MSYGPAISNVTQSYYDDPELRRRIEAMRQQQAAQAGANPSTQKLNPTRPNQTTPWEDLQRIGSGLAEYGRGVASGRWATPYADQPATDIGQRVGQVANAAGAVAGAVTPTFGTDWDKEGFRADVGAGNYGTAAARLGAGVAGAGLDMLDPGAGHLSSSLAMAALPAAGIVKGGKKAAAAAAATERAAAAAPLTDLRVAQRVPTAVGTPLDPAKHDLRISMDAMREDPEMFANAASRAGHIVREKTMTSRDPEEILGEAKQHMMANLDAIYQRQDPNIRERSKMWYPGGNKLLGQLAEQYGVPNQSAAGAVAALSPQKDWFQNFDLARRTMESLGENPTITREMLERIKREGSEGIAKFGDILEPHIGKRLSDLSDKHAAMGTVVHDLTTRSRAFPQLAPEGFQMGNQMNAPNAKGVARESKVAWGSAKQVANAIQALRSGGDISAISGALGDRHKVRNFYNNLIAPSGRFDDYTSDTHNIAASLLRPLAGKDPEVALGLGAGVSSAATGARGLYGVHADAGRELAQKYGVAPFEVQSPTWEGVRSLFPDTWKTEANKASAAAIWEAYRKGHIGFEAAQNKIFKLSPHDVNQTPWR
jgi:hypothetical protein